MLIIHLFKLIMLSLRWKYVLFLTMHMYITLKEGFYEKLFIQNSKQNENLYDW